MNEIRNSHFCSRRNGGSRAGWWVEGSDDPEGILVGLITHGCFDGFSSDFFCNKILGLVVRRVGVTKDLEFLAKFVIVWDMIRCEPLTRWYVFYQDWLTGANRFSFHFVSKLWVTVLDAPNGVYRAVYGNTDLLLT